MVIIYHLIDSNVAVKSFFVISGLLIWISAIKTKTLFAFSIKRLTRIYPALLFVLCGSAIFIYIFYKQSGEEILKYLFWNILFLNFVHPSIGDTFHSNVIPAINGSLWTLKLEVAYYCFVGICIFFFRKISYKLLIIFTILSFLLESALYFVPIHYQSLADALQNQIFFKFYYFGLGVIIYQFEKKISTKYFILGLTIGAVGYHFLDVSFVFLPILATSFVFLVAFRLPAVNLSKIGDLSYGAYIFHFPIIQIFVYNKWFSGNKYLDFVTVIILVVLLSKLSWECVEHKSILIGRKIINEKYN